MNILKLVMIILIATTTPALAYTDPGSGLLLLQMLGSAFVGVLFYFSKIKQLILHKLGMNKDDQE